MSLPEKSPRAGTAPRAQLTPRVTTLGEGKNRQRKRRRVKSRRMERQRLR